MYKPAYNPALTKKRRIDWGQTLRRLNKLYHDPRPLLTAEAPPEDILVALGYRRLKRKLPKLKSNVCRTMDKIMQFFLKAWNEHSQPINFSISTNFAALAKACHNQDRQTAYLHVGTLIEHGFLRGKQRLQHGVQLLLNPELLRFEELPQGLRVSVPAPVPASPPPPRIPVPEDLPAAMLELAKNLAFGFSTNRRRQP